MHLEAYAAVAQMIRLLPELPRHAVEVGSANINGTVRPLFAGAQTYLGIDRRHAPGVDLVVDAWLWRPGLLVDCVVCCEVLEHSGNGPGLAARLLQWLRPGGHLMLTWATPSRPPHGIDGGEVQPGEIYRGWSVEDVRDALVRAGGQIVWQAEDPAIGDAYLLARRPES